MLRTLRYGADSSVRLDFADSVLVAECGTPRVSPLADPALTLTQALAEPLEYPPLARSTTPGDRIAVALDQAVPHGGRIASAVVESLVRAGVHPDGVSVLRCRADVEAGIGDPRPWLPEELAEQITLLVHDPTRRDDLAYLAATESGDPVLLNRAVIDADVVVPVGCCHSRSAAGYYGVHGVVFPAFSDQRTIRRFRSPSSLDGRGRPKRGPGKMVDEVGWLLGVTFAVQLVPGPGDQILHVVAGEAGAVADQARALYEAAWRRSVPRRASLVVATIEGSPEQQTWHNLGLALAAAATAVEDRGAIALCCDLKDEPGPAVRRLADAPARPDAMRWVRRECPEDALCATLLAQVLDRATVYLLSKLDRSIVEELDIAPITQPDELVRLAGRCESCILLGNAPHAVVNLPEDV